MTLRLGACLSLTGRYAPFGSQAAFGLRVWQRLAGEGIELQIVDDASDHERVAVAIDGLAARCDLLLGPYSTQLMRRAGEAMAGIDGVLFNHGGAGDDVQALCPGRIVSVLAPTSRYAVPFVRTRAEASERVPLWVVRGRGRFGRQVASGAVEQAAREALEAEEYRAGDGVAFDDAPEAWDLFSAGTFEDDVAIVQQARSATRPPRAICSIAAGVREFAAAVDGVDGVYGIAQWFANGRERPELGPDEREFVAAYRDFGGGMPDYPAVQAAAAAVIATHCAQTAGGVEPDALWSAASELDTTTLLGPFRIDPTSGAQVKHTTVLLRWRGDALEPA